MCPISSCLAAAAASAGAVLAPFASWNQLQQILQRLFPFGRGLVHAYWAPNFWALYSFLDVASAKYFGGSGVELPKETMTGGLVGEGAGLRVLPQILPIHCAILSLTAMLPALFVALVRGRSALLPCMVQVALSSFLFGFHVHEKAVLMAVMPMTFLAVCRRNWAELYRWFCLVANFSLFPLLVRPDEYVIKISLTGLHYGLSELGLARLSEPCAQQSRRLARFGWCVCWGCFAVEISSLLLPWVLPSLPFLPLMLRSVVAAIGMLVCWVHVTLLMMKG